MIFSHVDRRYKITSKGSGQNYYIQTGPSKPQNAWWSLPTPLFHNLKRRRLYCIATPLSSIRKRQ